MSTDRRPITCTCCGRTGHHHGRGLISPCYRREAYHGRLDQWAPYKITPAHLADLGIPPIDTQRYPAAERIADYIELRGWGLTQRDAADRMGVAFRTTTRWHRTLRAARATYRWLYDVPSRPHITRPTQEEKALAA